MYFLQYVHVFIFSTSLYGFSLQVADSEEVLRSVLSINLKDNRCNFFKIYIYLVLVENWLFSTEQTPVILGMWGAFLRSCSCQITSTDWRSYASKVCNCTGAFGSLWFCLWVPSSIIFFCLAGSEQGILSSTKHESKLWLTYLWVPILWLWCLGKKQCSLFVYLLESFESHYWFYSTMPLLSNKQNFSWVVTVTLDHMIGAHGDAFDLSLLFLTGGD